MSERWFGPVIALITVLLAIGAFLFVRSGMGGMADNLVYYWSPTELVDAGDKAYDATIRLGGQVEPGTVEWDPASSLLAFSVTDGDTEVPVQCTGSPPQMFREGIGVVVEGRYHADGVFHTDRVLVKHSNEYRAPAEGEKASDMFQTLVVEDS